MSAWNLSGEKSQVAMPMGTRAEVVGVPALILRAGYTGDLGYEVFVEPRYAEKLWDAAMELSDEFKMRPSGLLALDQARIEAGLLSIEADFRRRRQSSSGSAG